MGYYVETEISEAFITNEHEALKAINQLHTPEGLKNSNPTGATYKGGKCLSRHYAWVSNPPKSGFKSLKKALEAWGYEYENGEITNRDRSKLGDDQFLWEALAPYIKEGAEVIWDGEDRSIWKYSFNDGVMTEYTGKIQLIEV
jgi:hypothetical protein